MIRSQTDYEPFLYSITHLYINYIGIIYKLSLYYMFPVATHGYSPSYYICQLAAGRFSVLPFASFYVPAYVHGLLANADVTFFWRGRYVEHRQ